MEETCTPEQAKIYELQRLAKEFNMLSFKDKIQHLCKNERLELSCFMNTYYGVMPSDEEERDICYNNKIKFEIPQEWSGREVVGLLELLGLGRK